MHLIKRINSGQNSTFVVNLLSIILVQGLTFLTSPIFTRILGTEQYGLFSVYISWVSVISCILSLGLDSTLSIVLKKDIFDYKKYKCSALAIVLLFGFVLLIGAVFFGNYLSELLDFSYLVVVSMVAVSISNCVISFAQSGFIFEKKPVSNFILSFLNAILTLALSLLFVFLIDDEIKYVGRIQGAFLAHTLVAIPILVYIFFNGKTFLKKEHFVFGLKTGLPIMLHVLSLTVLIQSDRIMMDFLETPVSEIGKYSIFYSFSSVLTILLTAFNNSWVPFFYDDLKKENFSCIKKKSAYYIEVFSILTIGFILLSKEVGVVYAGSEYESGVVVIPILVSSIYFTFMYQFFVNAEFYHAKGVYILIGTVIAAFINIALNYFTIKQWGIVGAAISTSLSYFLLFLFHVIITRFLKIKSGVNHLSFCFWAIPIVLAILSFYFIPANLWFIRWIIGFLVGCAEIFRIFKRKTIW